MADELAITPGPDRVPSNEFAGRSSTTPHREHRKERFDIVVVRGLQQSGHRTGNRIVAVKTCARSMDCTRHLKKFARSGDRITTHQNAGQVSGSGGLSG
jgi:hypothetical protein